MHIAAVLFTVIIWVILMVVASFVPSRLRESRSPVKLLKTGCNRDFIRSISLISLLVAIPVILILNWCNASLVILVSYIIVCIANFQEDDKLWDISIFIAIIGSIIAGYLVMSFTQEYTSATRQTQSHKLLQYQIGESFSYGESLLQRGMLSYSHTITYICEDSYSDKLNLNSNDRDSPRIRFCIDAVNPRIEEITYSQELVEHVITGGSISLGSATFKEIVFYFPDVNILTPPPNLPDE